MMKWMVTIKVDLPTLNQIEEEYRDFITDRNIGYIIFVAKTPKNIITAYQNKKGVNFKVTIQGDDHLKIAKKYCDDTTILPKKKKENKESLYYIDVDAQIGSDEVGTGDFLAPIVVCAAFIDHDAMKLIDQYHIQDSKKLTDAKILELVPLILKKVHYEVKVLSNESYNKAYEKGFNTNRIKCILHNFVLTRLHQRCPYVKNVYVDQFISEENYYEYLKGTKEITTNIIFKEKGETYFPSVALASCIARYYLLQEVEFLSKKYKTKIPLGAGKEVDDFSKKFIEINGFDEFKKLCKQSFANYKNLMQEKLL